jgi:hypothetical protein
VLGCTLFFIGVVTLLIFQPIGSFSFLVLVLYSVSLFSNSFIVLEDRMVLFLLQTLLVSNYFEDGQLKWILITVLLRFSTIHINYRSHGTHLIEIMPIQFMIWVIIVSLITIVVLISWTDKNISFFNVIHFVLIFSYWILKEKYEIVISMIPLFVYLICLLRVIYVVGIKREPLHTVFSSFLYSFILLRGYEHVNIFAMFVMVLFSSKSKSDSFHHALISFFIGQYFYFAFGQQNTFNTINWNAAFVGFKEMNAISGILIVGNVFASQILCAIYFSSSMQDFLLIRAMPMLTTMILVLIERRHLMVWSIFAPKYIFTVLGFAVDVVLGIVLYLARKYMN